jgi:hypothetical protein
MGMFRVQPTSAHKLGYADECEREKADWEKKWAGLVFEQKHALAKKLDGVVVCGW